MAGETLERSIIVVTGPMAAGKSTVAEALAATFVKGVRVEGDVYRRFIVSGRAEMTPEPSSEALAQLRLRYELATDAAERFARSGYTVVVEDVIAGSLLTEFVSLFSYRPLHLVVLLPSEEEIARRDRGRVASGYSDWTVGLLHRVFETETPRLGLWLDTSAETPGSTVEAIYARAPESALP